MFIRGLANKENGLAKKNFMLGGLEVIILSFGTLRIDLSDTFIF